MRIANAKGGGLCVQQGLELGRGFVNVVRTEEQILLSAWTKMGLGDGQMLVVVDVQPDLTARILGDANLPCVVGTHLVGPIAFRRCFMSKPCHHKGYLVRCGPGDLQEV